MPLNKQLGEITEWRGIEGIVAAEVLCDDNSTDTGHGYVTDDVFSIAGVAELSRSTASNNETHYYDNMPATVISSTGADEVSINTSAIDLEVLAKITGQNYDSTKGVFIEGQRTVKYFALGYKTKKTNGDPVYVWRYKGTFGIPDSTHSTEDDGTTSNGQTVTYTGITTTHKFTSVLDEEGNPKGAKAMNVEVAKGLADVSTFFDTVTDPDSLSAASTTYRVTNALTNCSSSNTAAAVTASSAYSATITAAAGYTLGTVTVYMGGTDISSTAVTSNAISIASVTGDIVVIANATQDA